MYEQIGACACTCADECDAGPPVTCPDPPPNPTGECNPYAPSGDHCKADLTADQIAAVVAKHN
eukprot:gene16651-7479_t